MILYEVLRRYPPVTVITRKACKKMQLGNLTVPAATKVMPQTILMHDDEELRGKDSKELNPLRLREGISKASAHPAAIISFGLGLRICVGQNFALIGAKVILIMILQAQTKVNQIYKIYLGLVTGFVFWGFTTPNELHVLFPQFQQFITCHVDSNIRLLSERAPKSCHFESLS